MPELATNSTKRLIQRALPAQVVSLIQGVRHLGPGSRMVYARAWFRRLFLRPKVLPVDLPANPRLLFVCHGNILRSAVAAAIYTDRVARGRAPAGSEARSAGTSALTDRPADPRGIAAARELGLDLHSHRAQRLDQAMVDRADLVLVMDFMNEAEVLARFPAGAPRVRLLATFLGDGHRPYEIRDPYNGTPDEVRASFVRIEQAVDGLAASLSLAGGGGTGNSR